MPSAPPMLLRLAAYLVDRVGILLLLYQAGNMLARLLAAPIAPAYFGQTAWTLSFGSRAALLLGYAALGAVDGLAGGGSVGRTALGLRVLPVGDRLPFPSHWIDVVYVAPAVLMLGTLAACCASGAMWTAEPRTLEGAIAATRALLLGYAVFDGGNALWSVCSPSGRSLTDRMAGVRVVLDEESGSVVPVGLITQLGVVWLASGLMQRGALAMPASAWNRIDALGPGVAMAVFDVPAVVADWSKSTGPLVGLLVIARIAAHVPTVPRGPSLTRLALTLAVPGLGGFALRRRLLQLSATRPNGRVDAITAILASAFPLLVWLPVVAFWVPFVADVLDLGLPAESAALAEPLGRMALLAPLACIALVRRLDAQWGTRPVPDASEVFR